ncbi:hypothetical protein DERP_006967 [Dermatophagoides pteronyssinus]|uniref:Uncharacterized protein n=1 Tax=Dermatophagoides pteronyssinus TaxID=6956 RepID=A0ABQ8JUW3_DERPT|nr:hypothetical protein DERP_006967 [Dermatophagoides pteronyssinus]
MFVCHKHNITKTINQSINYGNTNVRKEKKRKNNNPVSTATFLNFAKLKCKKQIFTFSEEENSIDIFINKQNIAI